MSPWCSYSLVSSDSLMHNAQNMRIRITDIWLLVIQDIATLRVGDRANTFMCTITEAETQTHTHILYILGPVAGSCTFFFLIRAIIWQQQSVVQQPVGLTVPGDSPLLSAPQKIYSLMFYIQAVGFSCLCLFFFLNGILT